MKIEQQFEEQMKKFQLSTSKTLLECAIQKGLSCGYFIETEDDLYEIYKDNQEDFKSLVKSLAAQFRPVLLNGLSDRRVEMALRVSLLNTLLYRNRMKINDTYISNLVFTKEQLIKGLVNLDGYITQNPLAFLIDDENSFDYMSIIKGKHIGQIGLSVKNGNYNTKDSKYFITRQRIDEHIIEDVIKHAYHPTVWYLIITGNLLSYSHLFNKVKEYVKKFKALPKNG